MMRDFAALAVLGCLRIAGVAFQSSEVLLQALQVPFGFCGLHGIRWALAITAVGRRAAPARPQLSSPSSPVLGSSSR